MVNLMKKATSFKNKKTKDNNNLEVDIEAMKILRKVGDREAFYFYEAVGKPTGEVARNLSDFLDKVKTVKSESLVFHLQRMDFPNWVGKTLGDSILAEKLGKISRLSNGNIRTNISKTVKNHIKELTTSSQAISIRGNEAVIPVRI